MEAQPGPPTRELVPCSSALRAEREGFAGEMSVCSLSHRDLLSWSVQTPTSMCSPKLFCSGLPENHVGREGAGGAEE